jgi:ABC-2 type transport system permease protein
MIPIAVPYIILVAKGTDKGLAAVMLLVIPGTLLVWLSAGVGVLVSSVSPTNLVRFAAGFVIVLLLAAPTQLPGGVQELPSIAWFIAANPITAVANYQTAVIIDGEAWTAGLVHLLSPIIALVLVAGLGPRFLNRRLSLEGGLNA